MNIKKLSSSLTAAISLLALNGAVMADDDLGSCDAIPAAIMELHDYVACDADPTADGVRTWKGMNPIWLFGKSKNDPTLDGCSVHEKVNKLLFEEREEGDGTEPPWKGKGNGKNGPKGAYHALQDNKPLYAAELLGQLWDTLDNNANAAKGMQKYETYIRDRAEFLQMQVLTHCF